MANKRRFCSSIAFQNFATLENQLISMPKFLAGRHYNEEEVSQHLEKNVGYWPVQMNGNKFATGTVKS
jgi:hypothetical protein